MNTFILIVILYRFEGGMGAATAEFNSLETCERARIELVRLTTGTVVSQGCYAK